MGDAGAVSSKLGGKDYGVHVVVVSLVERDVQIRLELRTSEKGGIREKSKP